MTVVDREALSDEQPDGPLDPADVHAQTWALHEVAWRSRQRRQRMMRFAVIALTIGALIALVVLGAHASASAPGGCGGG